MLLIDDELVKILEIPESDLKLEIAVLLFQKKKSVQEKLRRLPEFLYWNFGKNSQKEILI